MGVSHFPRVIAFCDGLIELDGFVGLLIDALIVNSQVIKHMVVIRLNRLWRKPLDPKVVSGFQVSEGIMLIIAIAILFEESLNLSHHLGWFIRCQRGVVGMELA